jgi:hypothetical protein
MSIPSSCAQASSARRCAWASNAYQGRPRVQQGLLPPAPDEGAGGTSSCKKHNDPIPEPGSGGPASGKFLARLPKSLHAALIERSKHEGVSMNQYLTALVAEGLGKRAPTALGRDGRRSAPAALRRAPQHA